MQKRKPGQPHRKWKDAARQRFWKARQKFHETNPADRPGGWRTVEKFIRETALKKLGALVDDEYTSESTYLFAKTTSSEERLCLLGTNLPPTSPSTTASASLVAGAAITGRGRSAYRRSGAARGARIGNRQRRRPGMS